MREHHCLGFRKFCGRRLLHVAEFDGRWLALVGWHAAPYIVPPASAGSAGRPCRAAQTCPSRENNSRFLGLPGAVRTPRLVSRVLGAFP